MTTLRKIGLSLLSAGLISGAALCHAQSQSLSTQAEAGDASAQTALANLYFAGTDVPQDYALAKDWYLRAAEQGDSEAQYALGQLYATGLGVQQDYAAATKWFEKSAASGNSPGALHALATIHENGFGRPQDYKAAAGYYEKAATLGFLPSVTSLGVLYQNGQGVAQDYDKARALYAEAAETGDARAQNNLAILYTKALGVDQDYALAAKWYKKAADQGLSTAMTNLGVLYENGYGVPLDEAEARRLYRLAGEGNVRPSLGSEAELSSSPSLAAKDILQGAKVGNAKNQYELALLLLNPEADISSERTSMNWLISSANQGYAPAMALLAKRYADGQGVPQDYLLGYMWANLAISSGASEALNTRDTLTKFMTTDSINAAQLRARKWKPISN